MTDPGPAWIGRRAAFLFLACAALVGIALRCALYFANRSLWVDEAMLAWSLINRPFAALPAPLAYNQAAPLGFLFLVKAAVVSFGGQESALRLVSLLAGIASIFLFYALCKLYFEKPCEVCVPAAFFAVSSPLVYYSAELKQYSLETAVALSLSLLAARLARGPSRTRLAALALGGALAVWFSYSCCLVLAGLGSALLVQAGRNKRWPQLKALALAVLLWLISFAAYYEYSIAALSKIQTTVEFHADAFLPVVPTSLHEVRILYGAYLAVFENPVGFEFRMTGLAFFLAALGVWFEARRDPLRLGLTILPVGFTLLASALHKYPFTGRLILFLAPNFILLLSSGITGLSRMGGKGAACIGTFAFVYLLQSAAVSSLARPFHTYREELRPLLRTVSAAPNDYDALYIYSESRPAFDYYQKVYGFQFKGVIRGGSPDFTGNFRPLLKELDGLPKKARVWVLFSHVYWSAGEQAMIEEHLSQSGPIVRSEFSKGCHAYLVAR